MLAAGWEPTATPRWRSCATRASTSRPYKRVRRLEFAELPKTISGKIRRVELREAEHDKRDVDPEAAVPGEWSDRDFPELRE